MTIESEMRILRLRLGPGRERADDVLAEEDHQVIALRVDHQTRRRSDAPDDIEHGVGVPRECPNAGLLVADEWPDERFRRL